MNIVNDANDLIETQKLELEGFRKNFNIEPEKFMKAVKFCEKILDGEAKSKAYANVFEVSIEKARTTSSQFHRSRWVQELILFLRPDEQSLYFGERKRIIQAGMAIIDDPGASHRDKTEAMKALQPYIKQEKIDNELNVKIETIGESISDGINKQLEELAAKGQMIADDGTIIDVSVIE
jgi:hypothetical protein